VQKVSVISSFPRSGNTWVRFLVATAILGERPDSGGLNRIIPDLHLSSFDVDIWREVGQVIAKSHYLPDGLRAALVDKMNIDLQNCDLRIIHIIRNPFDNAISNLRYGNYDEDILGLFFESFIDPKIGISEYIKHGMGTWVDNNDAWFHMQGRMGAKIEIFRYKDLIENPLENLEKILEFLGVKATIPPERVVELCSASKLRKAEDNEVKEGKAGFFKFNADHKPTKRFINEATFGTYKELMDESMIELGLHHAGPTLERYGYDLSEFRV
jgi:hypothetical protein